MIETRSVLLASVLVVSAASMGCNKSEASQKPHEAETAPTVAAPPGPKVESDTYLVEMKQAGDCKTASDCTVAVTLVPKGAYHINAQYPYRFKTGDAPEGVTFTKTKLERADGTFVEKKGEFKVPFNAAKAGSVPIRGTFSFSVCSESKCAVEKQELEARVDVK